MQLTAVILIVLFALAAAFTAGLFFYTFYNAPKKRKKAGDCFRRDNYAEDKKSDVFFPKFDKKLYDKKIIQQGEENDLNYIISCYIKK